MEFSITEAGKLHDCLMYFGVCGSARRAVHIAIQKVRQRHVHLVTPLVTSLGLFIFSINAYATAPVGATPGSFTVSSSGAATYSAPIVVPPGTNGMVPKLSLNYNSQGGNGLVGIGWSIGGLSVIHHCGATIAIDGFKGGVNYDVNDRFCLDGERLIWVAAEGVYSTQHESWQKIVAYGGTTSDPSYFTVTSKDGTVRYYGATSDSRIEAQGKTVARIWALNKIQDPNGNYLAIAYQEENASGDFRPGSITYTGNAAAGVSPYNFVYFDYDARSDVAPMYEGGSLISTTKLLTGIRTCTDSACLPGSTLARKYILTYASNGAVGRSRLTSVQECGTDEVCLPATIFSWQDGGTAYTNSVWSGYGIGSYGPHFGDLNGDGKMDYVTFNGSTYNISVSTGTGYTNQQWWYPALISWLSGPYYGDANGDGAEDFFMSLGTPHYYALSTGSGSGNRSFANWSYSWGYESSGPGTRDTRMVDLNGDGRADYVAVFNNGHYVGLSTGAGYTNQQWNGPAVSSSGVDYADLNGDGKKDFVTVNTNGTHYIGLSTGTGYNVQTWTGWPLVNSKVYLADLNGDGKDDAITIGADGAHYVSLSTGTGYVNQTWHGRAVSDSGARFADLNGDGKADFVTVATNGTIYVSLSNGADYINQPPWTGQPLSDSGAFFVDLNGDGKADYVTVSAAGTHYVSLSNGPFPDLLASVTDGLGAVIQITYYPLTAMGGKGTQAQYPYQDVQNATYVAQNVTVSNGVGGVQTTRYWYYGLKRHLLADVNLGFARIQRLDPTGLVTDTYYNQTLDGTEGTVASIEAWNFNYTRRLKYVGNSWTPVSLGAGRTLAQLSWTVEETRELNNSVVTTVNTTYSNYDAYGNPGAVVVDFNDGWRKTTANTYNNDAANWQLGQLLQSQVTAEAPSQLAKTRTSSFSYDSAGRPKTEVIEPNNASFMLATAYNYDAFGNRTKKTVSGADMPSRDEYTRMYDARGQFMAWQTNALTYRTNYNSYDPRNGAVTSLTDPNNLTTIWEYNDGFARKIRETRPDGTYTTYLYSACDATCPALAKTMTQIYANSSGTTWLYRDLLGREVRSQTQGFGGAWIYRDTAYDYLGRLDSVSHPYYSGEAPHYTTYTYAEDVLGRLIAVTEPGAMSGSYTAPRVTSTAYNGLTTTVTNPKGQIKTMVKNSQGQVASVTDAAGTTQYQYDPFGNLVQVTDPLGNVSTMTCNIRGLKIAMHDPDMGNWSYGYDALGQLKSQTDAKGQIINMDYDKLGRMTIRTLPNGEGTSNWYYDTAAKGIGKLANVTSPNANETYSYDILSRPSSATTSIGGVAYTTSYNYDAYSRLLTLTYPETGFTLYHVYDPYGHLTEVHKDSATGLRYWQANTVDAHGRLTWETLGNGLVSQRTYDHATGDLTSIQTGTSTNATSAQNLSYAYDALGNLTSRADAINGYIESFGYDTLNRLTSVGGPAPKSFAYYPNGNIQNKSDVGTYTYPTNGVQPHAVTAVAGAITTSYAYDANGNQLSGNGRTISYTSFNKPATIAYAGTIDTFTYDANFNRVTKATSSSSFVYVGKLYERVTTGTNVVQKHFLYAGAKLVGVSNIVNGGSPATNYFLDDNLGSVAALASTSGVSYYGYDAHGKRRNSNGTDVPITTYLTGARRGYTGHEHDDEVGLINMNAREYDYVLGRFITPDTVVPGATNSQSYNRYSYALNNPLTYTDPTGQWSLRKAVRSITKAVSGVLSAQVSAARSYVDWNVRTAEKAAHNPYVRDVAAIAAAYYTAGWASNWATWAAIDSGATTTAAIATGDIFGGAAGGFVAGGITGGNTRSAFYGGVTGGIFGGVSYYTQDWSTPGRIGAKAFTGGVTANFQGGDFRTGFLYEGATATASWGYQKVVGIMATPEPGRGLTSEDGRYRPDAETGRPPYGYNVFGNNERLTGNFFEDFFKQGGALSVVANQVPGLNAVAYFHDTWMNQLGTSFNAFTNYSTMPAAAIVSYGALLDGPLAVQLAVDRSR